MAELKQVTIYTDGACEGNPGRGGYAAILLCGEKRREVSGGYLRTTNNRMEITAVLEALRLLQFRCRVQVYSDSQYVVNAISQGWAARWKAKGWMRTADAPAMNADLWDAMLLECAKHEVTFHWVRGHAGHPENERCDELSVAACKQQNLPDDVGYGLK